MTLPLMGVAAGQSWPPGALSPVDRDVADGEGVAVEEGVAVGVLVTRGVALAVGRGVRVADGVAVGVAAGRVGVAVAMVAEGTAGDV